MMAFLSILVAVSLVTININAQSCTGTLSTPVIILLVLGLTLCASNISAIQRS